MSTNKVNAYDVDSHIAEIYDTYWETDTADVEYLRGRLQACGAGRVLEPFCGTGRILIPLAQDGREIVGMDQSRGMLGRARMKTGQLPEEVQQRITLIEADVTAHPWPTGFDVVLLGGNCFYELATPEEQEGCIISAAQALRPGGYLFIDHDCMEGDLAESWRKPGLHGKPPYTCADGTLVQFLSETVWFDAPRRLHRDRRIVIVTFQDGRVAVTDYFYHKHPVSAQETRDWLIKHGFLIHQFTAGIGGPPWTSGDGRAAFWAQKER
jgi:SAM-dependent methyltransferase